ncbi:MAG: TRAP transporter substrate-binding protein DctP, partial [Pseudorhodoplanes sp.]|nr:TRAP transporter substrate-binding protein DctP [Pseudorhodoplanes sp.]
MTSANIYVSVYQNKYRQIPAICDRHSEAGQGGTMKYTTTTLLIAAFALSLALPNRAAAKEWKSYTYIDAVTTPAYRGLQKLSADFEKATGGAILIKPNVGGSLPIKASSITQAVGDGVLQIADDMAFVGNIKIGGLIRLPFLMDSSADYDKARAIWIPYADKELARVGVKLLAEYHYPAQVLFSSKPVTKLEDIKGLKIRVSSPEQAEFVNRFGGIPVTLSPPDVPSALQSGVINGVLTASAGGGRVWRDFFTHNYRLPVNWTNSLFIVNQGIFDALGAADKEKLVKAARDAAAAVE